MCLGAFLRFTGIDEDIIQHDEAFSWRLTTCPTLELMARLTDDVHPPLHFLILKIWVFLGGDSLFNMRSLSAIAGIATIPIAYYVFIEAVRYFDHSPNSDRNAPLAGLVVAAFVSAHGLQVEAARTARMYSLGAALALLSAYCMLKAINCRRKIWWIAYALTLSAYLYCHYFSLLSIAAQALALALASRYSITRGVMKSACVTSGIALAVVVPWLAVLWKQVGSVSEAFWTPEFSWSQIPLAMYYWAAGMPSFGVDFHFLPMCVTLATAFFSSYLIVLLLAIRRADAIILWYATQAAIPWVLCIGISIALGKSILLVRCLVFAQLFAFGLIGALIYAYQSRMLLGATTLLWCLCLYQCAKHVAVDSSAETMHLRSAIAHIVSEQPNNGQATILVDKAYDLLRVAYYLRHEPTDVKLLCRHGTKHGQATTHIAAVSDGEVLDIDPLAAVTLPCTLWMIDEDSRFLNKHPAGYRRVSQHHYGGAEHSAYIYVAKFRKK